MEMLHRNKRLLDHLFNEIRSALGDNVELAKEVIESKQKGKYAKFDVIETQP